MSGTSSAQGAPAAALRTLYVRIMLRLLPHLVTLLRHPSAKIRAEIDCLAPGFTFMLSVKGTGLAAVCTRTAKGSLKRVAPRAVAVDVEPGSGLPTSVEGAVAVDYVIAFRSLAYAFRCFSGGMTLKDALAERAFATRGPNDAGVALTYMFTALLRMFFGWRAAYRRPRSARIA